MTSAPPPGDQTSNSDVPKPPLVELWLLAIGALVLVGLLGYLLNQQRTSTPDIDDVERTQRESAPVPGTEARPSDATRRNDAGTAKPKTAAPVGAFFQKLRTSPTTVGYSRQPEGGDDSSGSRHTKDADPHVTARLNGRPLFMHFDFVRCDVRGAGKNLHSAADNGHSWTATHDSPSAHTQVGAFLLNDVGCSAWWHLSSPTAKRTMWPQREVSASPTTALMSRCTVGSRRPYAPVSSAPVPGVRIWRRCRTQSGDRAGLSLPSR